MPQTSNSVEQQQQWEEAEPWQQHCSGTGSGSGRLCGPGKHFGPGQQEDGLRAPFLTLADPPHTLNSAGLPPVAHPGRAAAA